MEIEYRQPKGSRIKNQFTGIEIEFTPKTPEYIRSWCYGNEYGDNCYKWLKDDCIPYNQGYVSSYCNEKIKSLKAAKRHLKKHENSLLKGTRFTLHNKFKDYEIYITI